MIYDMHCHYGFAVEPRRYVELAEEMDIGGFCNTVTPEEYLAMREHPYSRPKCTRLGLGAHPWWIADGRCDEVAVQLACDLAPESPYIGEIGLDFSDRILAQGEDVRERQLDAVKRIMWACADEPHLYSIHAVRSADVMLDLIESLDEESRFIFHWFSGSQPDLERAIELGCYFSINPRMARSKRGAEYIRIIPEGRVLVESDLPSSDDDIISIQQHGAALERQRAALEEVLEHICVVRGHHMREVIEHNSRELIQFAESAKAC